VSVAVNPVTNKFTSRKPQQRQLTVIDGALNATSGRFPPGRIRFRCREPVTNKIYVAEPGQQRRHGERWARRNTTATVSVGVASGIPLPLNPATKQRSTSAKRQQRQRDRDQRATNATGNGSGGNFRLFFFLFFWFFFFFLGTPSAVKTPW